jgi:DNA-3-methyladenine glycosylase II
MHTHTGTLAATPPFSFAHALAFMCDFGPLRDDTQLGDGWLGRALLIEGQPVAYRVSARDGTPGLAYTLWSDAPLSAAAVGATEGRITSFLSLGDDLAPLYALAADDPPFQQVVEQLHGYHQVTFPSAFEVAVWAILSQRNTAASARTMRAAIADRYGARLVVEGRSYRAFPEPERVAADDPGAVTAVVRHAQKGPCIAAVAAAFSQIDERWLCAAPYDEALRWLLDIHGIGPWGASFILLRGAGRMERLPSGERKLLAAIGKRYHGGGPVSEREAARLGARYGAYQGYWAHYLRVAG